MQHRGLTRRSFIGAASAALSLVGIKLPEAKAKTLVSIPGPTQPQLITHWHGRLDGVQNYGSPAVFFGGERTIFVGNGDGTITQIRS